MLICSAMLLVSHRRFGPSGAQRSLPRSTTLGPRTGLSSRDGIPGGNMERACWYSPMIPSSGKSVHLGTLLAFEDRMWNTDAEEL